MMLDGVLEIIKPDPDSQYCLVPCKCGSDNVAYMKYMDCPGEAWAVQCFDCGRKAMRVPGVKIRHEIQVEWNRAVRM